MEHKFETIAHFRQLGGCKTTDGRTIKYDYIYRSGELSHVSDEELDKLNALNIKTVFDLRSTREQLANPDIKANYEVVLCPLASPARNADEKYKNQASFSDKMKNADESYYNFGRIGFGKGYMEFVYNRETISKIIEAMNRHEIFLYHCFGGKDRTGTISMLIMLFLGCDYDECKRNYMLHREITIDEQARYIERLKQNGFSEYGIKLARYYSEVCDELFDCAYYAIFDVYKSIEDYLKDQFDIDKEQIEDWKNFYLE